MAAERSAEEVNIDDASSSAANSLRSQARIYELISASVTSMALKCAVELRIADIIHSHGHGGPISLSQIASGISDSPSLNISFLERVMRLLVHKKIFTAHRSNPESEGGDDDARDQTLYGLTELSKWLLWDAKPSLAQAVMLRNHPILTAPMQHLSQSVRDGELAIKKAHGCSNFWEFTTANPELEKMLTEAMLSTVNIELEAFLRAYKDELGRIGSLVDVGGRTGKDLCEIVKSHPHIKGINFELPEVVATAPVLEGVSHLGGDMFEAIPRADAVFLKGILRDWPDERVVKILENCRKAIPENTGKVIIQDIILNLENDDIFAENHIVSDLSMMMFTTGRERTEGEWKKLLKKGGFSRYKVIKIPARTSIIEARP